MSRAFSDNPAFLCPKMRLHHFVAAPGVECPAMLAHSCRVHLAPRNQNCSTIYSNRSSFAIGSPVCSDHRTTWGQPASNA
jgi:hypothetical protein